MSVLTLQEQAMMTEDPRVRTVLSGLSLSELSQVMPFKNVDGGAYPFLQDDELPDADFRAFDEQNEDSTGTTKPQAEVLKVFGKDVKTDSSQIALFGVGAHRRRVAQSIKAMRLRLEDVFINGNLTAPNPRHFDGMAVRLPEGSSQCIRNHATGSAGSLAAVDELLDAVDAPRSEVTLVMGKTMKRKFNAAMRNPSIGGNIWMDKDQFGAPVMRYGEARIVVTDVDNRKRVIQGFTEPSNTASIYAVVFADGMCAGIQGRNGRTGYGVDAYDVGEMHTSPTFLTRIVWHCSMVIENERAAARLSRITDAPLVA